MERRLNQRCQFPVILVPHTKKDNIETKGAGWWQWDLLETPLLRNQRQTVAMWVYILTLYWGGWGRKPHTSSKPRDHEKLFCRLPPRGKKVSRKWPYNSSLEASYPLVLQENHKASCQDSDKLWFKPLPIWIVQGNQDFMAVIPLELTLYLILSQQMLKVHRLYRSVTCSGSLCKNSNGLFYLFSQMATQ